MSLVTYTMRFGGKVVILADKSQYPEVEQANSYYCPIGVHAGRGEVLMLKSDLESIKDNHTHYLIIDYTTVEEIRRLVPAGHVSSGQESPWGSEFGPEFGAGGGAGELPDAEVVETTTLGPFYILNNYCVGMSSDSDDSLYVVEFADRRILAERFSDSGTKQFNLHTYARDIGSERFLNGTSSNATVPHEWQHVVDELWPSIYGSAPDLPYDPLSTPDDLSWYGCNPWTDALPEVMKRLGCNIVLNPITDSFSIVWNGKKQSNIPELPAPIYRGDSISAMHLDAPGKIAVYTNDWGVNYGIERDTGTGLTGEQWLLEPPFERSEETWQEAKNDADLNADEEADEYSFSTSDWVPVPGTVKPVWLDTKREYNNSNTETNTEKKEKAREEVRDNHYRDMIIERQHRIYAGMFSIVPGERIKAVAWYDRGGGFMTEYTQHPGMPSVGQIPGKLTCSGNFQGPDITQAGFPNYPRVSQLVKVVISSPQESPGENENPLPEYVFEAKVCMVIGGAVQTYEDCYLRLVDGDGTGNVQAVDGDFFNARLMGTISASVGGTRPLYVARRGDGTSTSTPDSSVKILRVVKPGGGTTGEVLDPISECCYAGKLVAVAGSPDFCSDPFTEGTDIWVARLLGGYVDAVSPLSHDDEFIGYKVSSSFTPSGQSARALYLVRPEPRTLATYRAEIYSVSPNKDDDPFQVTISEILEPGTQSVGSQPWINNDYGDAAVVGAKCFIVEHMKTAGSEFYALAVDQNESTAGWYRGTITSPTVFDGDTGTVNVEVTKVMQKGTLDVGETAVGVLNDDNFAGDGTSTPVKCTFIEAADGTYYLVSVERTKETVYIDGVSITKVGTPPTTRSITWQEKESWGHHSGTSLSDALELDMSQVIRNNNDGTFQTLDVYHIDTGAAVGFGETINVVSSVTDTGTDIVFDKWQVTVFAKTDVSDDTLETEECP